VVFALGLFVALAATVTAGREVPGDRLVFQHLYSSDSPWPLGPTPGQHERVLEAATPWLYRLADSRKFLLLVLTILVILLILRLLTAAFYFIAALAVVVLAPILKHTFDRPSPFPRPGDPSFPSGHAMASMAIAGAVVVLTSDTRWFWPAVAFAAVFVAAVGVAVITDGGHWPSDVVGGWLIVVGWLCLLRAWLPTLRRKWSKTRPSASAAERS
jgi:membrane-associated phospholipid phosphatase